MIGTITTAVPMFAMIRKLQQCAELDLVHVPRARDEGDRMAERRFIQHQRRYRRDERDEVEHTESALSSDPETP
jgi:hypothetical protein